MKRAILGTILFFYICIASGQEKNYIRYARALNDLIRARDQKTEDSLYFRNSGCIDSLLDDKQTPAELAALLHFMQARRLAGFTSGYLKFNRARYETPDLHYNYAAMSGQDLDSLILWHFASVKKGLSPSLKAATVEETAWLSSDAGVFLFKPSLRDILMAEEIGYLGKKRFQPDMTVKMAGEWMKYTPDRFITLLDSLRAYPGNAFAGYGEWLSMEGANPHARGFIEMLARKYLYQRFSGDTSIDNAYESYLLARTKDSITEVKAHAVYQLCLLWNSKANIREGGIRDPYLVGGWVKRQGEFPDITYTPARALQLYEDNKDLFDHYADLRGVLEWMRAKILSKDLQASIEKGSIPGEPVIMNILYKNTSRIWYRIIRQDQDDTLPAKRSDMLAWLLHKREIWRDDVELPLPPDNASHRTSLTIRPLPPGEYSLLFADHPIGQETDHLGRLTCSVSRMVLLSSDGRVGVLDRKTGQPLAGVALQTSYTRTRKDKRKQVYTHRGATDREGTFILPEKEDYQIRAVMKTDTLADEADAREDEIRDGYDADEDTPMEYYEDKASVAVFTDRSIYRPGQKVFFKAIVMTKDLRTGARIFFNKAGIKRGVFQTWLREEKPVLVVEDPFYRDMDTIPVRPNGYGSFSGSFRIPDHAATGEWRITSKDMDMESSEGIFHVEEYKRPRFECKVQKPEKTFLPGDPVSFTLRVRTLTGAAPGNTRIRYTIRRSNDLVLDSSGVTDERGLLTVTARDTAFLHTPIADSVPWTGYYALRATATDLTGESHEVNSSLEVSSRPVRIKLRVETACSKEYWEPLLVTTVDPNGLSLSKDLQVMVYRVSDDDREQMIYESRLNTGTGERLTLPVANWQAGVYRMKVHCRENGRLMGETSAQWKLFDLHSNQWSFRERSFFYLPYNYARAGDTLRFFAGTAFDSSYILMQLKYYSTRYKRLRSVALFRNVQHSSGVYQEQWQMPQDATGQALLTWLTIHDNTVYREQRTITINRKQDEPRIIIEQFRDRVMPGEKAHFTVSVKTRDQAVAAELLSTIYDASLDLLQTHAWEMPRERPLERPEMGWPQELTGTSTDLCFQLSGTPDPEKVDDPAGALQGRAPGLSITNATGYYDVVVVGYGTTTRRLTTGSLLMIRGASTWPAMNKQALIILDGVPYTGDLSGIDIRSITDGILLEGADATSLYGSRAANGAFVLSTKGKLVLPQAPEDPPAKVRSRFDETAYFIPALYADKDGYYHFVFTLPESVTEWVWKILALTKKAQFAYAERKFQTRLPLMIQPQLPRFLCQGDQVTILSRISNLDSGRLSGRVTCRVEDATTGEDLSAQLIRQAPSDFSLSPHSVTSIAMILKIPQGQLHPVRLIFKASTHDFADGEAQVLPVIPTRLLLSRHQPFSVNGAGDTLLSLPPLPAADSLAGIGLSLDVPPQNALISALPWLASYSYDCAEQTFNKLLAECTAFDVFRKDTALQRTYNFWARKAVTDRDTAVTPPDMPAGETTPWESLTDRGKRQTQDLIHLFDTAGSRQRIEAYLNRLYQLQNADGGLSWFDGGTSNYYMSGYVLAGFGKLRDQRWQFPSSTADRLDPFLEKLVHYGDAQFLQAPDLWYAYARQYWLEKYPPSAQLRDVIRKLPGREWKQGNGSLRRRALRIIISAAWLDKHDSLYLKMQDDLQQLYGEAIADKQNGLRWKAIADDDDLDCSAEETLALLAEAFQHSPRESEVRAGILQWLLQNRADHHWTSTKATAAVIRLLGEAGMDAAGVPRKLSMVEGADTIRVSDEIMAGRQSAFIPASSLPRGVTIKKSDTGAVSGHLGLYYFGSPEDGNDSQSFVHLSKSLYVYNDSSRKWEPVKEDRSLHVGDKVKTVLVLATAKPLHFLFIRDQVAAAMEPAEVHSGYDYEGDLSFYKSIRDTGGQFFFDLVPSGKWEISYESRISHAGSFTGGPASLECMYKPEIHAYSQTVRVLVE